MTPEEYQIFLNRIDLESGARYFLKNIFFIDTGTKSIFIPYEFQQRLLLTLRDHNRVIGWYPRQMGVTTTVSHYLIWLAAFQQDSRILVVTNNMSPLQTTKQHLNDIYRSFQNYLPVKNSHNNANILAFDNSSVIIPCSQSNLETYLYDKFFNVVWMDNCDYCDEKVQSLINFLLPTACSLIITTSGPSGECFNQLYHDANNNFYKITAAYNEHPKHDIEWFNFMTSILEPDKFNNDYLIF